MKNNRLLRKANKFRIEILKSIFEAKTGHIGGAYSCIDILTALYYGGILTFDPKNPKWDERDRFILSKGHSGIAQFVVLGDLGFFEASELKTFCKNGTRLGGHPSNSVPGIEIDTGSLGHGLGIGCGIAWRAKMDKMSYNTFVLTGDAECYEGSIWEAILFAAHYELNNLILIVDRNKQAVMDFTEDCLRLNPVEEKFLSFGWNVETVDGHSINELTKVFSSVINSIRNKPTAIIANTIKGKGVSFMEGNLKWHHSIPSDEEYAIALKELSNSIGVE